MAAGPVAMIQMPVLQQPMFYTPQQNMQPGMQVFLVPAMMGQAQVMLPTPPSTPPPAFAGSLMAPPPMPRAMMRTPSDRSTCSTMSMGRIVSSASDASEVVAPADLAGLPVQGNVWRLSRDGDGCRRVQAALEDAACDDDRVALAEELKGHIWQAMRCPNANHVLQKCFMTMRPKALQFILDELVAKGTRSIVKASQNQYACRVLQRMVEHCRPDQVHEIVEPLMELGSSLARHIYGTFVMQHLLEHGTESQKTRLVAQVIQQVCQHGPDPRSGRVLRTALAHASPEDQVKVARTFLRTKELAVMARDRHAHCSAQEILELVTGEDLAEAQRQLQRELPSLQSSRYGRKVVASLNKLTRGSATHGCA